MLVNVMPVSLLFRAVGVVVKRRGHLGLHCTGRIRVRVSSVRLLGLWRPRNVLHRRRLRQAVGANHGRHGARPLPGPVRVAGQAVVVLPAHDAAKVVRALAQHGERLAQAVPLDPAAAVGRVGDEADDELVRRPAPAQHHVVHEGRGEVAPAAVELGVVPGDVAAAQDLERLVVEAGEVGGRVEQAGGDGRERDEEGGAKVGAQAIDEAHDAREAHLLLDVEVEAVEAARADEVAQRRVVALEAGELGGRVVRATVEALVGAPGRAAEEGHDADAGSLEHAQLGPGRLVPRVVGAVVVEGQAARVLVDVDGGEDDVRHRNVGLRDEGQDGDGLAVAVVQRLVVRDEPRQGRRPDGERRHGVRRFRELRGRRRRGAKGEAQTVHPTNVARDLRKHDAKLWKQNVQVEMQVYRSCTLI